MKKSFYNPHGLLSLGDDVFKGMGESAILSSRKGSDSVLQLFGGRENFPSSIMRAERGKVSAETDAPVFGSRRFAHSSYVNRRGESPEKKKLFSASHVRQGSKEAALSIFPQNIGRSVILFYSEPGAQIVDPFAGHNSRMELCVSNGRHYTGYDISVPFMEFNKKRAGQLKRTFPSARINLHLADSRRLGHSKDNGADFTLTSPPYYDIEFYGDEAGQLGKSETYEQFLDGLQQVLAENLRCLKPGAFAVWFVNDFRRLKTFHPYHMDCILRAQKVGFVLHDIIIVDLGPSIRGAFVNQVVQTKIIPKRHEYGLVFKKP